jgi:DNA-binding response OmpR family regulator
MAPTVLIVDDEPTILEVVGNDLQREGFRVVRASTGPAALEQFRGEHPDVILLDLMLPELSGTEVCRIIRRESTVPILVLSAKDAELDKVVLLELGADDYVTKPFSLRELRARVAALLRRTERPAAEQPPPGLPTVGRVQVDLSGHRLLRDGLPVAVKPKAFELLAFLVQNPGQVFRREQLLERVWGTDYPGETRTVDVHVHWLRREIEPDPARPATLQTVRGVGYVLRRPPA